MEPAADVCKRSLCNHKQPRLARQIFAYIYYTTSHVYRYTYTGKKKTWGCNAITGLIWLSWNAAAELSLSIGSFLRRSASERSHTAIVVRAPSHPDLKLQTTQGEIWTPNDLNLTNPNEAVVSDFIPSKKELFFVFLCFQFFFAFLDMHF